LSYSFQIALMRSLITSVLLSVTNREIERIAEEQLTKEKNKGWENWDFLAIIIYFWCCCVYSSKHYPL